MASKQQQVEIYMNVLQMLREYRSAEITSGDHTADAAARIFRDKEYIEITAQRRGRTLSSLYSAEEHDDPRGDAHFLVYVIDRNSKYVNKKQDFDRLLANAMKYSPDKTSDASTVQSTASTDAPTYGLPRPVERFLNIIFVIPDAISSSMVKERDHAVAKRAANGGLPLVFETLEYKHFVMIKPQHVSVPEHRLVSRADAMRFLAEERRLASHFPRILTNDAIAVWYGFRPGNLIMVRRPSENAGYAYCARVCAEPH
jgi:DNA-directed RNA polymerase subunit H (RpoH/RPB5)